jgi:hypothetical protein
LLIAALSSLLLLAFAAAQDPNSQVPPGYPYGQYPSGQPSNGNYPPGGYGHGPYVPTQPTQQSGTFGGPSSPDAINGGGAQEARPYGPIYQPGQPQTNGAVATSYLGPAAPASAFAPPVRQARLCEGAQIVARVGDDVILTGDLPDGIDDMLSRAKNRIPADQFAQQRAAIAKEVADGIHEYAVHVDAGEADPAKGMSDSHRMWLFQLVRQQMDVKLIYQDFIKSVPKENLSKIEESVDGHFDNMQVKALMKREKVTSMSELENALLAKGSSVKRERKIFKEQLIAQQWAQQQIKPDGDEITHQDMIDWYNAHIKEFEQPARVRWDELMVSFARHPNHDEAWAVLGEMGNRVIAGALLGDVAHASSEGATARQGGKWDWTLRDSLESQTINDALFNIPVGQLSQRLEGADGYHIVRVVERQEVTRTSFLDAQKEVKEKIQKERFEKKYKEYVEELRKKFPVWTVFDSSMAPQHNPDDDDRYATH